MFKKNLLIFLAFVFVQLIKSASLINSETAPQSILAFDDGSLRKLEEKIDKINLTNDNFRLRWEMLQMRLESQTEQLNWLNQKVDLLLKSNPKTACFNPIKMPVIDVRSENVESKPLDAAQSNICTTEPTNLPRNCFEATATNKKSGIFKIQTNSKDENFKSFYVSCDAETRDGGWTVVLRRKDGSIDFFRDWHNYKNGFGNLEGEFFIGLEKLYQLTEDSLQELLIVMEDFDNVVRYAKYETFAIGSSNELYAIKILGKYSGDAGDSLTEHAGAAFTTKDADHDTDPQSNCANTYTGGWWHKKCHVSNLMGQYLRGAYNQDQFAKGVVWKAFRGYNYSLKYVQMMIRPKK